MVQAVVQKLEVRVRHQAHLLAQVACLNRNFQLLRAARAPLLQEAQQAQEAQVIQAVTLAIPDLEILQALRGLMQ